MKKEHSIEELQKKVAELEQKNSQLGRKIKDLEAAEDSKERIAEVFRSTPQMMAISNQSDGRYIEVNETVLKTLGYRREEIIGKSSGDIDLFANIVQSDKFIKKLARLKKVQDFDITVRTKSGEPLEFKFSAEPVIMGEDRYLLTTYRPVNKTQTSLEEINKTFDRLRDLFESLTNFVMIINPDEKGR